MNDDTEIGWTEVTWNPTFGCTKVSAGCKHCYSERIAHRFGYSDHEWTAENAEKVVKQRPDKLDEPYSIEPSRIFVNSMSDLFHNQIETDFIKAVVEVMRDTPQHVYQILTKRPKRAADLDIEWPDNVWLGTSVENADVTHRIDQLRGCDPSLRFISFEPLIGPVGDITLDGIEWVIVGGESGPNHREMDHTWAQEIYRQARDSGCAFFFKQSSGRKPEQQPYLTIESESGVPRQEKIQEEPPLPTVTQKARSS